MDDQCIYYTADRYNIILVGYYIQVAYYIYIYVCMCMCMCICTCICIYIHIHIGTYCIQAYSV